jgi:DNA-binding MarR family transcriptional regulator
VVGGVVRPGRLRKKDFRSLLPHSCLSHKERKFFGAGDADVLVSLRRHGPPFRLRPSELQRLCVVTSGAITGRIDRLAGLGLVERLDFAVDRRGSEVHLTRRGVRFAEKLMREIFEKGAMPRALRKFTQRERQTFEALLERLHAEMERESSGGGD